MIFTAKIRCQNYRTNPRRVFVPKGQFCHGVAKGTVFWYNVQGSSWAHIRRMLKTFEVAGFSQVGPQTVEEWSMDLGDCYGRMFGIGSALGPVVDLPKGKKGPSDALPKL